MFRAIKPTHSFAAVMIAAVSFSAALPMSSASASELFDIVVVPADDHETPIAAATIEPAAYNANFDASFRRVEPTLATARLAPVRDRSATQPTQKRIAWPYTARTISRK